MGCCSQERHRQLKADRLAFLRGTYYVGLQCVDETFAVRLFNCATCESTLGVELDAAGLAALTPPCAVETVELVAA